MNEVILTAIASAIIGLALGKLLKGNEAPSKVVTRQPKVSIKVKRRSYTEEEDLKLKRVRTSSGIHRLAREMGCSPQAIKARRHFLRRNGHDVKTMKIGRPPVFHP